MSTPTTRTGLTRELRIVRSHLAAVYTVLERIREDMDESEWNKLVSHGHHMYYAVHNKVESMQAMQEDKTFQNFLVKVTTDFPSSKPPRGRNKKGNYPSKKP